MRSSKGARVFGGAIAASAVSLTCLTGCPQEKPAATLSTSESWCPDGFEVGPQDTCFAVPETTTRDTPVLVYLHGQYAGHGSPEEWRLIHSVTQRGFAVVVPRGKRGLCAWKAELKDHFCWPQEIDDPAAFKATVAEWDRVLWQVDAIMEGGPHKRYVLGFSNGGSFATFLATHNFFPAQAYAIVNAGPLGPTQKPPKATPLLLVSAAGDNEQGRKMKELHDGLGKSSWTHAYCSRPGEHPLAAQDVEAALAFFKHESAGALKSGGSSYPCEAGTTTADPSAASSPSEGGGKSDKSVGTSDKDGTKK